MNPQPIESLATVIKRAQRERNSEYRAATLAGSDSETVFSLYHRTLNLKSMRRCLSLFPNSVFMTAPHFLAMACEEFPSPLAGDITTTYTFHNAGHLYEAIVHVNGFRQREATVTIIGDYEGTS